MRTTFLIDGFNLYHSIVDLERYHSIKTKWLNIDALLKSYLPLIGNGATLNSIFYFTALRGHLQKTNPETILRHIRYIKVLKSYGIIFELGRFKEREIKCKVCQKLFIKYEEKRTDVAIASKLLLLVHQNYSENYVIISGDTDLIPAIKSARLINPNIKIYVLFPCGRKNDELISVSDGHFAMKAKKYQSNLLPPIIKLSNNRIIHKPTNW